MTWLQEMEKKDPKLAQAWRVVGNQSKQFLRNMVRALSMMSVLNTDEDNERLAAAKYILKEGNKR